MMWGAGELAIDLAAAETAVRGKSREPLGVDLRTAAAAVIDVVNNAMAEVLKIVSVQRGHDPRDFSCSPPSRSGAVCMPPAGQRARHIRGDLPPIPGAFSALRPDRHGFAARLRCRRCSRSPKLLIRPRWRPLFVALERKGAASFDRAGIAAR